MAVELGKTTLETALWLAAPVLLIAMAVALLINVVQVLTSLQDSTLSAVPRLAAVGVATVLLMPWMTRRLSLFLVGLFSDFRIYLR